MSKDMPQIKKHIDRPICDKYLQTTIRVEQTFDTEGHLIAERWVV